MSSCVHMMIHMQIHMQIHIHIYVYKERERDEKERLRERNLYINYTKCIMHKIAKILSYHNVSWSYLSATKARPGWASVSLASIPAFWSRSWSRQGEETSLKTTEYLSQNKCAVVGCAISTGTCRTLETNQNSVWIALSSCHGESSWLSTTPNVFPQKDGCNGRDLKHEETA